MNTEEMQDTMKKARFVPGDKVYTSGAIEDMVRGSDLHAYRKSDRRRVVELVCVDETAAVVVRVSDLSNMQNQDTLFSADEAKKEVTRRIAQHLVDMQDFPYGGAV